MCVKKYREGGTFSTVTCSVKQTNLDKAVQGKEMASAHRHEATEEAVGSQYECVARKECVGGKCSWTM